MKSDILREKQASQREGRTLLLVEDSRMFSSVLSHRFETELGLTVTHCASQEALDAALKDASDGFTMAVVGLNLPGSTDGEALDQILEQDIPAVVFTASFNVDVRNRITSRNVVDYVVKDNEFALDNLIAAVRRAISNRRTRVLVVDDVVSARSALVELLEAQQFKVCQAGTGIEALEVLERHPDIELVLTDHHMPDMDGYELTRRIRNRYSTERIRVIGISSSGDRLLSASFLKAGASDFVYRPFVPEELQCRISNNIETLTQLRQLRAAAASDYLTGLYNRRYFYDQGPRIVTECLRGARPASVAVLDIDHFKQLNDTRGHEIGDRVLKAVAARLQSEFIGSDNLLSRVGGEEFAMLFAGLDSAATTALCDRVREDIQSLKIVAEDEEDISVTVSIGVAEICGYETFENYLNAADQYLYMAKRSGRNQVYSDARVVTTAAQ